MSRKMLTKYNSFDLIKIKMGYLILFTKKTRIVLFK